MLLGARHCVRCRSLPLRSRVSLNTGPSCYLMMTLPRSSSQPSTNVLSGWAADSSRWCWMGLDIHRKHWILYGTVAFQRTWGWKGQVFMVRLGMLFLAPSHQGLPITIPILFLLPYYICTVVLDTNIRFPTVSLCLEGTYNGVIIFYDVMYGSTSFLLLFVCSVLFFPFGVT